ncbi:Uncharacterised protein [Candidatus Gugararchaeum adminiculabundum]|nr:Uncharacterised protein [Candidatus Gugararchaeum adminiculabundum]
MQVRNPKLIILPLMAGAVAAFFTPRANAMPDLKEQVRSPPGISAAQPSNVHKPSLHQPGPGLNGKLGFGGPEPLLVEKPLNGDEVLGVLDALGLKATGR